MQQGRELDIGHYRITQEPFYAEVRGEIELFTIAANSKMPVMLKGQPGVARPDLSSIWPTGSAAR